MAVQRSCSGLSTVFAYSVFPSLVARTWPSLGSFSTWMASAPTAFCVAPGEEAPAAGTAGEAVTATCEGLQAARISDKPINRLAHHGLRISEYICFIR